MRRTELTHWSRRLPQSVLLFALLFSIFTKVLGKLSGIGTTGGFLRSELPVLVSVYAVMFFVVRESRFRPYIAALPITTLYLFHDYYYS